MNTLLPRSPRRRGRAVHHRAALAVELGTAAAAVVGGALLMAAPDGSLLHADPTALDGSPFSDWFTPGLLLAILVGGGFGLTAIAAWRGWPYARLLQVAAGTGLIVFESFEVLWIGPQPLEAVFAAVGAYLLVASRDR